MFKNLIIYALGAEVPPSAAALDEVLLPGAFTPCGKTQQRAIGWAPPRGIARGALVESVGGQWILRLIVETKLLPDEVVKRAVDEDAAHIHAETGRWPGKRQRAEMTEEAMLQLLPQAFTTRVAINAWLRPDAKLLMVDASSQAKADLVAAALIQAWPKMNLHLLKVNKPVDAAMARWLMACNPPFQFTIDRDAVLESSGDDHAVVRYQHHTLDAPDVRHHLRAGKVPTQLALTFDARVSLLLFDDLRIHKIDIADGVFMEQRQQKQADAFDADVAIATGELHRLVDALIDALGGRAVLPIEAAADAATDDDQGDYGAADNAAPGADSSDDWPGPTDSEGGDAAEFEAGASAVIAAAGVAPRGVRPRKLATIK